MWLRQKFLAHIKQAKNQGNMKVQCLSRLKYGIRTRKQTRSSIRMSSGSAMMAEQFVDVRFKDGILG
jgi:hypothetical protein